MTVLSMGFMMPGLVRSSALLVLPLIGLRKLPAPVEVLRLGASLKVRSLRMPSRLACLVVSFGASTRLLLSFAAPPPLLALTAATGREENCSRGAATGRGY